MGIVDEIVYDGWLKVYKRKIEDRAYDILRDHDAVTAIIVNEYNELLLVKQFRPALMEETLELPAGTLDVNGENETECLIRELSEETGLRIEAESIKHTFTYKPMMGFSNSRMKVFVVKVKKVDLLEKPIKDQEVYEAFWMSLNELGEKISRGEILDVKTLLAYYYISSECLHSKE